MRRTKRTIGKRIAQAALALLLMLVVAEGAFAADGCECPDCPAHVCMHVDCAGGNGGVRCADDLSGGTCASIFAATLAPAPRSAGPTFSTVIAVTASAAVAGDAGDSDSVRRMAAPRFAAPPAHIVFCRLLR